MWVDSCPGPPLLVSREGDDGEVLHLTLNRPRVLNAIDWASLSGLGSALADVKNEDGVRCILITGSGDRAFSAGADLRTVAELTPERALEWIRLGHRALNLLVASSIPSIAAVNGYALGGGLELALACDLRLAAESARLGLPEVAHGWLPGWGGASRLCAIVGPARARQVVLAGQSLDARSALDWGLVQSVVPDRQLSSAAADLARRLASLRPEVVGQAKARLTIPGLLIDDTTIEADARLLAETVTRPGFREVAQPSRRPRESPEDLPTQA